MIETSINLIDFLQISHVIGYNLQSFACFISEQVDS